MGATVHQKWVWRAAGWATCAGYFFITLAINWFDYGTDGYSLVGVGLAFVFVVYAVVTLLALDGALPVPPVATTVAVGVVSFLLLTLAVPPVQTDFYHYFFEDVAWLYYGQNPYVITPDGMPGLAASQLAGWQELASQHGPARLYSTVLPAMAGMASPVLGPLLYKLFFALVAIGALFLLYDILVRFAAVSPAIALLSVAWSPLVLYETQLSGGTDILMAFWLLASIALLLRRRWYWAVAALVVSALIKYATILLLPFLLYYVAAQQPTLARAARSMLIGVVLVVAITVASFAPFWVGPQTLASTAWVASHFEINSVPGAIGLLVSLVAPISFETVTTALSALFLIAYVGASAWYVSRRVPTIRDFIRASVFVMAAFLLAKSWFYPKYLIWLLPLMSMLGSRWIAAAAFLSGIIVLAPLQPDLIMLWLVPPIIIFALYRTMRDQSMI